MSTPTIKKPFAGSIDIPEETNEGVHAAAVAHINGSLEVTERIPINLGMTSNKPRWEDSFKPCTFYINKELLKVFEKKVKRMPKGGKTLVTNEALNYYLIEKPQQDRRIAELEAQVAALEAIEH